MTAKTTIFHITHWKAGSQWIKHLFLNLNKDRVVSPNMNDTPKDLLTNIEEGKIFSPIYSGRQEFENYIIPSNSIRFFVIRDLRDTAISYYFSLLKSHGLNPYVKKMREVLSKCSKEDGIIYMLDKNISTVKDIQESWIQSGIKIFRYEDLIKNQEYELRKLLKYCEIESDENTISKAIQKSSFKNQSKGRDLGIEDTSAHTRQGLPGYWRNHFTEKIKYEFKKIYSKHLILTQYEKNDKW